MSRRWPLRRKAQSAVPFASAPPDNTEPPPGQGAPVAGGQPTEKRGRGRPRHNALPEVLSSFAPSSLNPGPSDHVIGAGAQASALDEDGNGGQLQQLVAANTTSESLYTTSPLMYTTKHHCSTTLCHS
jgi:hypothetical protein